MNIRLGAFPFLLGLLLGQAHICKAFYWPGMEPVTYCSRSDAININSACKPWVMVFVNSLTSKKSLLPFEYHDFDFCLADESYPPVLNLGQEILGDRIKPSPIYIDFLNDVNCAWLCTKTYVGGEKHGDKQLTKLKKAILLDYKHNWIVDDMPVTFCRQTDIGEICTKDFDVGDYVNSGTNETYYFVNNHLNFEIVYESGANEDWGVGFGKSIARIVAVKVTFEDSCRSDDGNNVIPEDPLPEGEQLTITYTYSARFVQNNRIEWSARWNSIYKPYSEAVGWFYIYESLIIVFICSVCTFVLSRLLKREDKNANAPWTLLEEDIFRSPSNGTLLSSLIGCGVQALASFVFSIIYGCAIFKAPEYQGNVLYFGLVFFGVFGLIGGNISGRFYRKFEGQQWTRCAFLTAAMPGVLIILFFAMGEIFNLNKSSSALSYNTISFLLTLWFFVEVPLTFLGTFFGFYKKLTEPEVPVSAIPRKIPVPPFLMSRIPGIFLGGLLPFVLIFIQLSSIKYAYMSADYPILLVSVLLILITCAESSVLICYDQLRVQDYNWWWRSFLTSGSAALYMLIYCCADTPVYSDIASIILYILYTMMWSLLLFVMMGTVGFLACYCFIKRLYGCTDMKIGYYNENLSVAVAAEPAEKIKENILA